MESPDTKHSIDASSYKENTSTFDVFAKSWTARLNAESRRDHVEPHEHDTVIGSCDDGGRSSETSGEDTFTNNWSFGAPDPSVAVLRSAEKMILRSVTRIFVGETSVMIISRCDLLQCGTVDESVIETD
jgi:hypothetical protein